MTWRDDNDKTVSQLANMATGTFPNTAYWEAQAYLQISNIHTGLDNRMPVDQDFTDLTTALADSDVQTYKALLITTSHVTAATLTIPVAGFSLIGVGKGAATITSAASSSYNMITVSSKDQFVCSGMTLIGGTSATGDIIRMTDSDIAIISNIEFKGAGTFAIQTTGTSQNNMLHDLQTIAFTAISPPDIKLIETNSSVSNCFINVT